MEQLFGRAYDTVGSTNSDFIIKTRGQVKIQWGAKFIDLIKDGKINSGDSIIFELVDNQSSIGTANGIYYVKEDGTLWVVIGGQKINLFGEVGNSYVSFLGEQSTTGDQKYTALSNIGFFYKTFQDANNAGLKSGIVYVEGTQKLYIVNNGELLEYSISIPNPFPKQFIIQKEDSKDEGALIIKGSGKNNAFIIDDVYLFSENNYFYVNNNNGPITIQTQGMDRLIISDQMTVKIPTTFEKDVTSSMFKSPYANSSKGFRLYVNPATGESFLEVDNLMVRNNENSFQLYPKYWSYKNNIIKSAEEVNPEEGEDSIELSLVFKNRYSVGDLLYVYTSVKEDEYDDTIILVPLKLEITQVIEDSNSIIVSPNYSEILDNYYSDAESIFSSLQNQTLFLVGNTRGEVLPILRYSEGNIDLINISQYDEEESNQSISTRIGNIKELNLNIEVQQGGNQENIPVELNKDSGIYSDQAILNKSKQFSSELFAPTFKGGPNKNLFPKYEEGFFIPQEDDSQTIVSSKWVKQWLKLICPPGTIVQWSGTNVPQGWALCDGNNGTPNLIDKFIKGGTSAGDTGGNKEIVLTVDNLPSHSHTITGTARTSTDGVHNHSIQYTSNTGGGSGTSNSIIGDSTINTEDSGAHSHSIDMSSLQIGDTGNNTPINIEPQFYTLMYIMKLDY